MNPNQALWEKGDFTRIAASMRQSGEEVVAGLGILSRSSRPSSSARTGAWSKAPRRFRRPSCASRSPFERALDVTRSPELGKVFGGLTVGCNASASGGCLQKFVKK